MLNSAVMNDFEILCFCSVVDREAHSIGENPTRVI